MGASFPSPAAQALFLKARELPAETREAWLRSACGQDPALLDSVVALLSADTQGEGLEPPSPETLAGWMEAPGGALREGRQVGTCRLGAVLGQGGMGRVHEAVHEPTGRRVAVKLLRQALPDAAARARFEEEARLLAAIDHPGVCRIHDAGTWTPEGGEPLPYCVMELVEGAVPVTAWATSQQLSMRARVELLARVASAVAASHAKGVLHRDLKPANVLVGKEGQPKVIDFGIARSLGDVARGHARLTRSGMVLGTPAYMSPEQLLGRPEDVDVRADVHALGAILYELLTGRLPRDLGDGSLGEAVKALRDRAPIPPRRHDPRIPPDLAAVVLKAVDSDPARRYASAADLEADLVRWLGSRPVTARAPGALWSAILWWRRHRVVAALAAALGVALSVGATFTLLSAQEARDARTLAETRRNQAETQRARAEGFLQRTRDFVPWLVTDHQRAVSGLPRSQQVVRALVVETRRHLRSLAYEEVSDADLLVAAARSYAQLAHIEGGFGRDALGMYADAAEDARTALQLARRAQAAGSLAEAPQAEFDAHLVLVRLAQHTGRFDDAERHAVDAQSALDGIPRNADPERTRDVPTRALRVAVVRGDLAAAAGDATRALERYREGFEAYQALENATIAHATLLELFAKTARIRAATGDGEGTQRLADRMARVGAEWEAALPDPADARADLARMYGWIADGANSSGGRVPALPYLELTLAAIGRWREASPLDRAVDREESAIARRLGWHRMAAGKHGEARTAFVQSVAAARRVADEDARDAPAALLLLEASLDLAEVDLRMGNPEASAQGMAACDALVERIVKDFPQEDESWVARARTALTRAALDTIRADAAGDPVVARPLYERAQALTREGARLFREATRHGFDAGGGEGIARECDAEVARLQSVLAQLGTR